MTNEYTQSEFPAEASQAQETRGSWFALSVNVRHEKVISELLRNKGFETFLPLYKRRHQYARRSREFELPLFPGYLFCRTNLTRRLPIMTTPGVLGIVGAGRTPHDVERSRSLRAAYTPRNGDPPQIELQALVWACVPE